MWEYKKINVNGNIKKIYIDNKTKELYNKMTLKQKHFVNEYLATGNWTKSAMSSYNRNYNTSHAIACENLQKPTIKEYLNTIAMKSLLNIEAISEKAKSESVRLTANQDILDRAGFSKKLTVESQNNTQINIYKDMKDEDIQKIISNFNKKSEKIEDFKDL